MKNAHQIMSSQLITLPLEATLAQADRLLKKANIRHLPITDATGKIVGIVSTHDLIYLDEMEEVKVSWLMRSPVLSVGAQDSLLVVCKKILDARVSSVLVNDSTNAPIGILTTEDLLREMLANLTAEKADQPEAIESALLKIGEVAQKIADTGI